MSKECPICEKPVGDRQENDHFPFCSSRCKQVDLGRWFGEDYSIPISPFSTERNLEPDDADEPEPDQ